MIRLIIDIVEHPEIGRYSQPFISKAAGNAKSSPTSKAEMLTIKIKSILITVKHNFGTLNYSKFSLLTIAGKRRKAHTFQPGGLMEDGYTWHQ